MIVTHFFLDCFPPDQLEQVITRLSRCAGSKATWLIADFQVPKDGWRRHRALIIHALMYQFFRAVARLPARRLAPPDEFLKAQGFNLCERQTSDWELLKSDLWRR